MLSECGRVGRTAFYGRKHPSFMSFIYPVTLKQIRCITKERKCHLMALQQKLRYPAFPKKYSLKDRD